MASQKAAIDKQIAKYGVEIVKNTLGGSYFYFAPLREDAPNIPSVYVYRFDELTTEEWIEHVAAHAGQRKGTFAAESRQ